MMPVRAARILVGSALSLQLIAGAISAGESAAGAPVDPPSSAQPRDIADPAQLPRADRQLPTFQRYPGRTLGAGQSYTDASTGARVTRLTNPATPVANPKGQHHVEGRGFLAPDPYESSHEILQISSSLGKRLCSFEPQTRYKALLIDADSDDAYERIEIGDSSDRLLDCFAVATDGRITPTADAELHRRQESELRERTG